MSYRDYGHEIDASIDDLVGKTLVRCDRMTINGDAFYAGTVSK